ncbi:MAG: CRISPR-associated endoribonuclease Cas6 [Cytophagales bacterium]|nr:CRISPR-associated protein Cas6 [Bernardetiaceae bacterium]MDW8211374.1 CRISPR-associated endoribonuclease Cas6 [Cytophagales bacterium]
MLRVRIIFKLRNKGGILPFHHQHLLASMVSDLTSDIADKGGQKCQFYNFSGIKGQTKVTRHGLQYFSNRVTLVFTCLEQHFTDYFLQQLFRNQFVELGGLILSPEFVEREESPEFSEQMKYVCLSPLICTLQSSKQFNPKDFIMPDTDQFSDLLYESTMNRLERSGLFSPEEIASFYRFQIVPDQYYLSKLSKESKKFARIYSLSSQDGKIEVRGYTMPFVLYAHPEVQRFVFFCGLGEATTAGYGMVDIANSDPTLRSMPYELQQTLPPKVVPSYR